MTCKDKGEKMFRTLFTREEKTTEPYPKLDIFILPYKVQCANAGLDGDAKFLGVDGWNAIGDVPQFRRQTCMHSQHEMASDSNKNFMWN